jgi:hypothetical protein
MILVFSATFFSPINFSSTLTIAAVFPLISTPLTLMMFYSMPLAVLVPSPLLITVTAAIIQLLQARVGEVVVNFRIPFVLVLYAVVMMTFNITLLSVSAPVSSEASSKQCGSYARCKKSLKITIKNLSLAVAILEGILLGNVIIVYEIVTELLFC